MNVPYVDAFANLEISIWLTLKLYGYEPIIARSERTDEARLCRICRMILSSSYCITDFTEKRLNVAVEYGLAIAAGKLTALLIDNKYDVDTYFSDRKSIDPIGHNNDPEKLILSLSEWIESNIKKQQKKDKNLISRMYRQMQRIYNNNYTYDKINLFYDETSLLLKEMEGKEREVLKKMRKERLNNFQTELPSDIKNKK